MFFNALLYDMCGVGVGVGEGEGVPLFDTAVCQCVSVHGYKFNFVCLVKTTIM